MISRAYFELSKKKVFEQYGLINELCDEVLYSYKTNFEVGKLLEGKSNFCIHSIESLMELKPDTRKKIWFFAQAWDQEEIQMVVDEHVKNFVVDNNNDLNLLLDFIKEKNITINLLLRMRLKEHTIHTGKYFVYGFYSNQVNELLPKLKANNLIDKLGIHFHRKTQNISEWSLKSELKDALTEESLKIIDIVDLGGGIPIRYKNYTVDVKKQVFDKITELREWLKDFNIKVFIEPGRVIAGPAVKLVATIKNIYDNNIVVDCSVYNSAMNVFDNHIRFEVEGELAKGEHYTIKGLTPDSMDIFRYRVFLDNPKIGDKIIFKNVGAYNYYTNFCNLRKLETKIVD